MFNNFNNNNQSNYGGGMFNQPVQSFNNNNPINILKQVDNIIEAGLAFNHSSRMVKEEIFKLGNAGLINIIGFGTNRIAFVLPQNIDLTSLYQMAGIPLGKQIVFKAPFETSKGLRDNIREQIVPLFIQNNRNTSTDLAKLSEIVPFAWHLQRVGILRTIAQERIRTDRDMFPNQPNSLELWKQQVMNTPSLGDQYRDLITLLDKYFVMADMSFAITPSNFGTKRIGNEDRLSPLDLGHVIPKYGIMESTLCPACKKSQLIYVPFNDSEIKDFNNSFIEDKLTDNAGYYRCSDINCTKENFKGLDSEASFLVDNDIFERHLERIRHNNQLLMMNPLLRTV